MNLSNLLRSCGWILTFWWQLSDRTYTTRRRYDPSRPDYAVRIASNCSNVLPSIKSWIGVFVPSGNPGSLQKVKFLSFKPRFVRNGALFSSQSAEEFVENVVKRKLETALKPEYIRVINESARHNVPRGSASHIRVTIVSSMFNSKNLVQRHRLVNAALQEELKGPIHALSIDAISPTEIKDKVEETESPPCRGGSKL